MPKEKKRKQSDEEIEVDDEPYENETETSKASIKPKSFAAVSAVEANKGQEKRNSSNFLKKLLKFFIKVLLTILVIALN